MNEWDAKKSLYYKEVKQIEEDKELYEELISAPQVNLECNSFETEDSLKIILPRKNEDCSSRESSMSNNVTKEDFRQSLAMAFLYPCHSESLVKRKFMCKDLSNKKTRIM